MLWFVLVKCSTPYVPSSLNEVPPFLISNATGVEFDVCSKITSFELLKFIAFEAFVKLSVPNVGESVVLTFWSIK